VGLFQTNIPNPTKAAQQCDQNLLLTFTQLVTDKIEAFTKSLFLVLEQTYEVLQTHPRKEKLALIFAGTIKVNASRI